MDIRLIVQEGGNVLLECKLRFNYCARSLSDKAITVEAEDCNRSLAAGGFEADDRSTRIEFKMFGRIVQIRIKQKWLLTAMQRFDIKCTGPERPSSRDGKEVPLADQVRSVAMGWAITSSTRWKQVLPMICEPEVTRMRPAFVIDHVIAAKFAHAPFWEKVLNVGIAYLRVVDAAFTIGALIEKVPPDVDGTRRINGLSNLIRPIFPECDDGGRGFVRSPRLPRFPAAPGGFTKRLTQVYCSSSTYASQSASEKRVFFRSLGVFGDATRGSGSDPSKAI